MKQLLYIVGIPGSGKTTALAAALQGISAWSVADGLLPFILYPGGAQLGVIRPGGFSGTDGYALNVQPRALNWLRDAPFRAVVAEGDRLANDGFFQAALDYGYTLTVAWLDTPLDIAAVRRKARGSTQDAGWVRGRITKVDRLVETWGGYVLRIDGGRPSEEVSAALRAHPVVQALRAAAP